MIAEPTDQITVDPRKVAYVAGTTIKVADIAIDSYVWGMSPLQIQANFPQLSPAQISAALSYYGDHKAAVDSQIARDNAEYKALRAEFPNPLAREAFQKRLSQGRESE